MRSHAKLFQEFSHRDLVIAHGITFVCAHLYFLLDTGKSI
jgi:hypothetical protein